MGPTTIEYHKVLLDNPDFKAGNVDTGFIPKHQDELVAPNQPATEDPRKNIVRNAAKKAAKKKARQACHQRRDVDSREERGKGGVFYLLRRKKYFQLWHAFFCTRHGGAAAA